MEDQDRILPVREKLLIACLGYIGKRGTGDIPFEIVAKIVADLQRVLMQGAQPAEVPADPPAENTALDSAA